MLSRISPPCWKETAISTPPYGATEALPIASISGREILGETGRLSQQGKGNCVGRPVEGIDARIIAISDGSIPRWWKGIEVQAGEIGEIAVSGPQVLSLIHI